jgi:hypothetical protein
MSKQEFLYVKANLARQMKAHVRLIVAGDVHLP